MATGEHQKAKKETGSHLEPSLEVGLEEKPEQQPASSPRNLHPLHMTTF